ncbi:substrate-binding domain-containing protein, partial [Pseudomonas oryzihabitans]
AAQLDPRALARGEGFREVLREAGCYDPGLDVLDPQPSSVGLGARQFRDLLAQRPDVDGLFFCNDDLAQGALFEAQRLGIAIPERISVLGFNDLPGSAHTVPRLSSIQTPRAAVGRQAATLLLGLLDGRSQPTCVDLGFELVSRESV